ncbi:MAG: hypothetical protein HY392_03500 [Candidatus Diapherotrites archaeon]|nr:hypothetical protein [Candidatus Diapherotrites archaeon]
MKKSYVTLAAFFLLMSGAFGTSLALPSSLPANVNWSFSVTLDNSDSFDKTVLFLDGKETLSAYPNGQTVRDAFNGQFAVTSFVVDENPSGNDGLKLFVSFIGLEPGTHFIKAETHFGGAIKDTQSGEINFFVPLDESRLNASISSIVSVTDSLKERATALENNYTSLSGQISEQSTKVEEAVSVSNENAGFISELRQKLEAFMSETQGKFSTQSAELASLGKFLVQPEPVEQEKVQQNNPGVFSGLFASNKGTLPTGFATFSGNTWLSIFLMLVAVMLSGVIVFLRGRKNDGGGFGGTEQLYEDKTEPAQPDPGKWATEKPQEEQ